MMPPRIVVDTNIFIGACLGKGAPLGVISACLNETFMPLMGAALYSEYESVWARQDLFSSSRLNESERNELLDIFLSKCRWTSIYFAWRPNLPDEADNHLIERAVAGGARFIVTRNLRDLQNMELKFPRLRIMEPEKFLLEITS